jgi:hypothetical protein
MSRGLHEFVDDLQAELNMVGGEIRDEVFTLAPVSQFQSQSS